MSLNKILVLVFGVVFANRAEAEIDRARLVLDSCPQAPLFEDELTRLLALELSPVRLETVHTSTAVDLLVTVAVLECGAAAKDAELAILFLRTGTGAGQRVHLDPRAATNARVLAVAAAEMMLRLRSEKTTRPHVQVATSTVIPWRPPPAWETALSERTIAEALERAERRFFQSPEPTPSLTAHLGVETFPAVSSSLAALAMEATVHSSTSTPLRLELGALGRFGRDRDLRGRITLWGASANISLLAWKKLRGIELAAGPRFGLGFMTASGSPSSEEIAGRRINGALAELWLDLRISWELSEYWTLGARTGAGYVFSGLIARADGSEVSGVDGAALGFALSIGRVL